MTPNINYVATWYQVFTKKVFYYVTLSRDGGGLCGRAPRLITFPSIITFSRAVAYAVL